MENCVIVVINNSKASFFTLEQAEWPEYESGPDLIEQETIVYSDLSYRHKFWSTLTGHSEDETDSTLEHSPRLDNKFGEKITAQIVSLVRINQCEKLILVAPSKLLEIVNGFFIPTLFKNLQIVELEKDLRDLKPLQIHHYLAQQQLIPAYQKAVYPA